MAKRIYLTFNDLKEDVQFEIYDKARDDAFDEIKDYFLDKLCI